MHFSSLPLLARLGFTSGLLLLAAACKKDSDTGASTQLPTTVTFTQAGLYPEGTQYDDQQAHFLVSSQTAGRIGQVSDNGQNDDKQVYATGSYSTFADDAVLISSIGLKLDAPRGRLLVAVSDPSPGYNKDRTSSATMGKLARLAVFDRSTGTKISYVDLSALPGVPAGYPSHFANDIAVDNLGNAYVTDSYAPIIYKVAFDKAGTPTASVFVTSTALAAPAGKFGLNGIVYHPNGYLLVAKSDEGALFKVPLTNPAAFTKVTLPAGLDLSNDDGLQLTANTTLLAVCNAQGKVYQLTSTDDFASVTGPKSYDTGGGYPTTLARRADSTSYVLQSHLDALQAMQAPPASVFALKKVVLK